MQGNATCFFVPTWRCTIDTIMCVVAVIHGDPGTLDACSEFCLHPLGPEYDIVSLNSLSACMQPRSPHTDAATPFHLGHA